MTYAAFLARKKRVYSGNGIAAPELPAKLYDWQRAVTSWALRKGRACLFADCGLGKSFMQIAWADALNVPTLFLAPLCVAEQTVAEAAKLSIELHYAEGKHAIRGRLTITNYERLDRFDPSAFEAVVLDESSILKAFDGKTRGRLIDAFKDTRYRLCCTATPSPNDIAELANHAEFLGLMTRAEFLATWFVHDDTGWRMKKHARTPFFRWLASWALALRTPSDLGYSDEGYVLPPLTIRDVVVDASKPPEGMLFHDMAAKGIQGRIAARCASIPDRLAAAVELMLKSFHDESIAEGVLPSVATKEQGVGEGLSRQDQGSPECAPSGALPPGCLEAEEGLPSSSGVAIGEPSRQKEATARALRPNAGTIRRDDGIAGSRLRDLRHGSEEFEAFSVRGSLPQDREGERAALHQLQSWCREVQGRLQPARESHRLSKWLVWCGLNEEQDSLARILGDWCVSVSGRDDRLEKIDKMRRWMDDPNCPIMLSKLKVFGFGMNFQHCHRMLFVGIGDSYEQYYQGVRRCWRFGQTLPVDVRIIVSEAETGVVANVRRKEATALEMSRELLSELRDFEQEEIAI